MRVAGEKHFLKVADAVGSEAGPAALEKPL